MKNKIAYKFLILALTGMVVFGCKSKSVLVQKQESKIDHKLLEMTGKITKAEPVFATANVSKMSASVEIGGRRFSTQASCKMRTDSCIHISVQPMLGIEMFKIEMNSDTIKAFDKFNKKVYYVNFDYFKKRFGIDVKFNDLQAIISNKFFTVGSKTPDLTNCRIGEMQNNSPVIEYQKEALLQKFILNLSDRITAIEMNSTANNYSMNVSYADFVPTDKFLFPQSISINAKTSKRELLLDFKVSKVVFDADVTFSNIDASKYTVGDINQLMTK